MTPFSTFQLSSIVGAVPRLSVRAQRRFWRKAGAGLLGFGLTGLLLCTVATGLARVWAGFDLFTHFQMQYMMGGLALLGLAIVLRNLPSMALAMALVCFHGAAVMPLLSPHLRSVPRQSPFAMARQARRPLRVAHFNVLEGNRRVDKIVSWLRTEPLDVVILQELSEDMLTAMERVQDIYPYQMLKPRPEHFGLGVLSREPLADADFVYMKNDPNAYVRIVLDRPGAPVLYGLHTTSPLGLTPMEQRTARRDTQLSEVAAAIAADPAPHKMLMGDLNVTAFSPAFHDFAATSGLHDTQRAVGVQKSWPTFLPEPLRISIDHALVSEGINVVERQLGPHLGSDHLPVIMSVTLAEDAPLLVAAAR